MAVRQDEDSDCSAPWRCFGWRAGGETPAWKQVGGGPEAFSQRFFPDPRVIGAIAVSWAGTALCVPPTPAVPAVPGLRDVPVFVCSRWHLASVTYTLHFPKGTGAAVAALLGTFQGGRLWGRPGDCVYLTASREASCGPHGPSVLQAEGPRRWPVCFLGPSGVCPPGSGEVAGEVGEGRGDPPRCAWDRTDGNEQRALASRCMQGPQGPPPHPGCGRGSEVDACTGRLKPGKAPVGQGPCGAPPSSPTKLGGPSPKAGVPGRCPKDSFLGRPFSRLLPVIRAEARGTRPMWCAGGLASPCALRCGMGGGPRSRVQHTLRGCLRGWLRVRVGELTAS